MALEKTSAVLPDVLATTMVLRPSSLARSMANRAASAVLASPGFFEIPDFLLRKRHKYLLLSRDGKTLSDSYRILLIVLRSITHLRSQI